MLWASQNQALDVLCLQGGDSLFRRWTFKQINSYKPYYLSHSFYTKTEQSCIAIIDYQLFEVSDSALEPCSFVYCNSVIHIIPKS